MSLLTDNGSTKDDLKLPTDDSLLTQVLGFVNLVMNLCHIYSLSLLIWFIGYIHRLKMDLLMEKISWFLSCLRWVKSRYVLWRTLVLSSNFSYDCVLNKTCQCGKEFETHKTWCGEKYHIYPVSLVIELSGFGQMNSLSAPCNFIFFLLSLILNPISPLCSFQLIDGEK